MGIGLLGPYISIVMDQSKVDEIGIIVFIFDTFNLEISAINFISLSMILIFSFRFILAILFNKMI